MATRSLLTVATFAAVATAVQTPYLRIDDNLEEPTNLGFCIDLKGWNPPTFTDAQAHSCKPSDGRAGGGTDEEFIPSAGQIVGRADAAGRCLQAQFSIAGSRLDAPQCDSANALQQFEWDATAGSLTLKGTGLCLSVGANVRQANSFWARDLTVQYCTSTETKLRKWRIETTPNEGLATGPDPTAADRCAAQAQEMSSMGDSYCKMAADALNPAAMAAIEAATIIPEGAQCDFAGALENFQGVTTCTAWESAYTAYCKELSSSCGAVAGSMPLPPVPAPKCCSTIYVTGMGRYAGKYVGDSEGAAPQYAQQDGGTGLLFMHSGDWVLDYTVIGPSAAPQFNIAASGQECPYGAWKANSILPDDYKVTLGCEGDCSGEISCETSDEQGGCGGGCVGGIIGGCFVPVLLCILWLAGAFGNKCPSPLKKKEASPAFSGAATTTGVQINKA